MKTTSRKRTPAFPLLLALAAIASPAAARAHFLWLEAAREDGKPTVRAFLSETPTPDLPEFLKHIKAAKVSVGAKSLEWAEDDNTYKVALPEATPPVVDGACDLGVMTRGGQTFRLLYTARAQFAPEAPDAPEAPEWLRLRLETRPGGAPAARLTLRGKPVAGALVKAFPESGDVIELKSDDDGFVPAEGVAEGRAPLLAKWVEKASGEAGGKPYEEIRYYATLTVAPKAEAPAPFAVLPEAINSFGGAVVGDWLYAYSGHVGRTHRYHTGTTTKHFRRLNLKDRTTWEELPCGPALQGVALVAHEGALYRVGGMAAHNAAGEPHDLISVADVARFDPASKTWTDLPPMPAPRSTHDAIVCGNFLYVVGGWTMQGGDSVNAEFRDDALRLDLGTPGATWETLPAPPFSRRALAVAAHGNKVYVIGGLEEDSKVTTRVDIYDPASRAWSRGPDMPGERGQGFGPSACAAGGRLFASGIDGKVYRLNDSGDGWDVAGALAMPRLTHRLLPGIDDDLLAVGGNFSGEPTRVVESVPLDGGSGGPRVIAWSVQTASPALQGQGLGLVRSKLLAVGGNRSDAPHAFDKENLLAEASRFSLGAMEVEPAAPLPQPRQSPALVAVTSGRASTAYLLGGIGHDGEVVRTLGDVLRLDPNGDAWTKLDATIPDARGMFGTAVRDGAIWVFGGSIFDPRPGQPKREMPLDVLRWDTTSEGATFEPSGQRLPRARRSFAGSVLGAKYYLVGGLGEGMKLVEPVDVFDFEAKTWGTIPAPFRPRLFADLVTLGDKLYLSGGFSKGDAGHFEPARSVEVFDPASSTWRTLLESAPVPPGGARMLAVGGRLLFFGRDADATGKACISLVAP